MSPLLLTFTSILLRLVTLPHEKGSFVYGQKSLFSMISVPCGTGDISWMLYRNNDENSFERTPLKLDGFGCGGEGRKGCNGVFEIEYLSVAVVFVIHGTKVGVRIKH